jgi:hypothetical protein
LTRLFALTKKEAQKSRPEKINWQIKYKQPGRRNRRGAAAICTGVSISGCFSLLLSFTEAKERWIMPFDPL